MTVTVTVSVSVTKHAAKVRDPRNHKVNRRCSGYSENASTVAHIRADKNGCRTTTHPTSNNNRATPPRSGRW